MRKKPAKTARKKAAQRKTSNIEKLQKARLVPPAFEFSDKERAALESLTASEVTALISTSQKLGRDFFAKYAAHGFAF